MLQILTGTFALGLAMVHVFGRGTNYPFKGVDDAYTIDNQSSNNASPKALPSELAREPDGKQQL